jgi:pimeloyl-ACP methyl ester carboxylesterase
MGINSSSGAVFGTPTVAGTFNFTVTVHDSGSPQQTASKVLSIAVANATSTLSITTTSLNPPTAIVGVGYAAQLAITATGGQTPYSWSASGLPNGMAINSSSGAVFGTPTVAGTFNFTATVQDSSTPQQTASKVLTITVASATPTLSITTTSLNPPTATVGVGYAAQQAITATGGQTPYSWSASGLPTGMGINSSSGAVFGTPTVAGTFNFTVTVHDSGSPQQTASKQLTLFCTSAQPPCALNCSADVPASGLTNVPIGFVVSSSSNSCTGTVSQSWKFGDGTTSSGSSVTHAYNTAGNFNWSVTTSQGDSTCVRSGSISIGAAGSGLPTIDYFRASHDQIAVGGTTDLTWRVRDASTITIDSLGNVAANSGTTVAPTSTTTYKLIATNSIGSQTATLIVRVDPILNVSIRTDRITGPTPLVVNFTILASGGVPPYRYQWSFGDTSIQPTHTWTTASAEDVSCTVTDAHGSIQKSNVLRIAPSVSNATVSLGFFDLTAPSYGYSSACPLCRVGASADGITKVKVRAVTSSPGTVTFSFVGTAGADRDGALFSFDGTGTGDGTKRLTVPTTRDGGDNVAAVYYQVPDDFANLNAAPDSQPVRDLTFSAQLAGSGGISAAGSMVFHLRHAPVVFVHGIWSHGSTWDAFALTRDPDLLYRDEIVIADWDGVSSIQDGASQVRVYLNKALQQMRMQGIAASSVDVVAHSMGGLIAKQISHDSPSLVHKLITLDTPHFGSALADYLIKLKFDPLLVPFLLTHPVDNGAVHDLRVDVGASARRVNTGSLRGHSVVGVASDDEPCEVTKTNQLPLLVKWLCADPFGDCGGLLTSVLNYRPNDEIVDVDSQRGGLGHAVSQFGSGAATGQHRCVGAHMNITSDISRDISPKVEELLDTNRASPAFETYSLPPASVAGSIPSTAAGITSALPVIRPRQAANQAILIAAPIDGQAVTPGSAIDVVTTAPSDFTSAFVVTPDQVTAAAAPPFRARIDIPVEAIGEYPISVRADTATGDSATASITLKVVPNAAITSLIVNPTESFLNVGDSVKPFVRGVFADGVTRDLSRSAAVAFASSNTAIVSTLPDVTLKATGAGSARITVFSGTASAELLINVESIPKRRAVNH